MQDLKKRTFMVKTQSIFVRDRIEFIIDGVKYCRKIHRDKGNNTSFKITSDKFSDERYMSPEFIEYMKINFGFKEGDKIIITNNF